MLRYFRQVGKIYGTWIASLPTVLSAGVACVTFVYTNVREQTLEDFNSRKKSIDEKLKNLYGPLYGNRLLFQSALDAVVKKHDKSIEALIKEICEKRDAEGLEDWRGYYKRCLAVLDQKALDIIQANSHLIHDDESRDVLRDFLEGASRQKYSTEIWREGDKWDTKHDYDEMDWVADNNNYQFHDHEQLCIHVREMNRYLTSIRNKIDQELARTYSGIATVDEIMHSVPRTTYNSMEELDKTSFTKT